MSALRAVAKMARMGDFAGIQKMLGEEFHINSAVREGYFDADRAMGRDSLPPLTDDPMPEIAIYNRSPHKTPWDARSV